MPPQLPEVVSHARAAAEVIERSGVSVVEVGGASMEPTLARGSMVRIGPVAGPVEVGQIVLVRTAGDPVIHRVVHAFTWRDERWILHAGDRGGRPSLAPAAAILGVAEAVLRPPGAELPALDRLDPEVLGRFERTSSRCRLWARLWCLGRSLGLPPRVLGGRLGSWLLRSCCVGLR